MPDETRVWIAQCLCGPNQHAIAALAGEADSEETARELLLPQLRNAVAELLRSGINPWCAICGAEKPRWQHEIGRTRFRSMAEAAPELAAAEAGNAAASAMFGTHGPTKPCPS